MSFDSLSQKENAMLKSHLDELERENRVLKKSIAEYQSYIRMLTMEINKCNGTVPPFEPRRLSESFSGGMTSDTGRMNGLYNANNVELKLEKEKTRMEKTKVTKVLHFKTDLQGHAAAVYCLAFAPTGILLASGSFDNSIRLWDLANPAASCGVLNGHSRGVNCLAWSSGRKLISGSSDETVKIWDYENSTCVSTIKLDGFIPSVNVHPFNENLIFASTSTKQLNIIDTRDPINSAIEISNSSVIFSSYVFKNGDFIITGDQKGTIKTWDARKSHIPVHEFDIDSSQSISISHVTVCEPRESEEEGRLLAANCWDSNIRVFDRGSNFEGIKQSRVPVQSIISTPSMGTSPQSSPPHTPSALAHKPSFGSLSDSTELPNFSVPASSQSPLNILPSPFSLNLIHECRGHRNNTWPITSSFYLGREYTGKSSWKNVIPLDDHDRDDKIRANTPNIANTVLLASGSADNNPCLYDVGGRQGSARLVQRLEGHKNRVYTTVFHSVEPILATAGVEGVIKIWGPKESFMSH